MVDAVGTSTIEQFKAEARRILATKTNENTANSGAPINVTEDKVTLGNQPIDAGTYTAEVSNALADTELGKTYTMLRDLFAATLKEQGIATVVATGNNEINLESLTPEEATELVADDGYFGVENTAKRIFDFATGLAGNDPGRLDAIISGIKDGFAEAEKAWGGTLPDISYATQDSLKTMLEDWSGQEIDFS